MDITSIKKLAKQRCAIERFRGQTAVYIPAEIVDNIGRETIEQAAGNIYTQKILDDGCWKLSDEMEFSGQKFYCFVLPPSLFISEQEYRKPDEFIMRIMGKSYKM